MNLTFRTLAAVLKYPWKRGQEPAAYEALHNKKWGAYESEEAELDSALERAVADGVMGTYRSVEADIMDWADDVSYAVHDTEDFFRAGLIPLDVLRHNDEAWREFTTYAHDSIQNRRVQDWEFDETVFDALLEAIRDRLPSQPYEGDFTSREDLHRFGSDAIRSLLADITIGATGDLDITIEQRTRVEILKKLTRYYVIDQSDLLFVQRGQRHVIRELFWALFEMAVYARADLKTSNTLPRRFDDFCDLALRSGHRDGYSSTAERIARATTDFICSLTDAQASNMWRQLIGHQENPLSRVSSL
jgi:dGTPase